MTQTEFGQLIFNQADICDLLMKGHQPADLSGMIVDSSVALDVMNNLLDPALEFYQQQDHNCSVEQWHRQQQSVWHMPEQYQAIRTLPAARRAEPRAGLGFRRLDIH